MTKTEIVQALERLISNYKIADYMPGDYYAGKDAAYDSVRDDLTDLVSKITKDQNSEYSLRMFRVDWIREYRNNHNVCLSDALKAFNEAHPQHVKFFVDEATRFFD